MLDPPTVDITGRMLEMLACYGYTRTDKRVEKAIKFISANRSRMEAGLAAGRELYLRDVSGAARARRHCVDHLEPQVQQAAEWIRMVQNADGVGARPAAAMTTRIRAAWAEHSVADRLGLLGLLAAGDDRSDSLAKGVRWLLERQQADGSGASR